MNSLNRDLREFEDSIQTTDCEESTDNTLHESIDLSDIRCLCVHYSDGKCGAALYHCNSRSIQLINQIEDNDFDSLEALLMQTEPNHVIVSTKTDPKLIQLLNSCAKRKSQELDDSITDLRQESGIEEQLTERPEKSTTSSSSDLLWKMEFQFEVHSITYKYFGFDSAKNRILSINMCNDLEPAFDWRDDTEKFLYLSSLMDFSDNNTFKSFGALLRFLDLKAIDIQIHSNCWSPQISSITQLYLQQLVTIERNTYESLQVFQQEWHPSAAKLGVSKREGLSIYGLFNCCVSKIGANYLRKLFLLPTQDIDLIMDRQLAIEFFMEPNHHILRDNILHHLKNIKSVNPLFNRFLTSDTLSISDFQLLFNNLLNGLRIRDLIVRQNSDLFIFSQIKDHFNEEMNRLFNTFTEIIDFEKSIESQSFEINTGIDAELDKIKSLFNNLSLILETMAETEIETYGSILKDCNCVYIPQMGFLTCAKAVDESRPPHQYNEELKYLVKVGDRYYYKTNETMALDQRFGDIQSEIIDRQIQIINQFQEVVVNRKHLFVTIVKLCAQLDALIAMSRTALTYQYTKPTLTTDGRIEIIDGRHPLIELTSNAFVPNDYMSGGQHKKTKMISGPNACGKSVYLKQVSLIVYLAHIGSYVPALSADISIVDRIFTRIHTPESVSLRLSTFMLDLNQMSNATKNATKRSLVVIDEFGKGTQPIDGLSLMAASIDHWLTGSSPHLVVSSHFRRLSSILNRNALIDCQTFEFSQTTNGLKYLFRLTDGQFKESVASQIALMADIPSEVVNRGIKICQLMADNKTIDCKKSQQIDDKYKIYEQKAKKFLRLDINSEEDIKGFLSKNFGQYSESEE